MSIHRVRVGFVVTVLGLIFVAAGSAPAQAIKIESPDRRIVVEFRLDHTGSPRYAVRYNGKIALRESRLGLVRDDTDFTKGMKLLSATPPRRVEDRYEILTAKRRLNVYRAIEQRSSFKPPVDSGWM